MTPSTFFNNFFSTPLITSTRLYNFATGSVNRLSADTDNAGWPTLVALLAPAIKDLGTEISHVDTNVSIRLGATDTVDNTLDSFKNYMHDNEPFIARALGGRTTPAYTEFFPAGLQEYTHITKTNAETLLGRISDATIRHGGALNQPLAGDLGQFLALYKTARDGQQGTKGLVADNRSERDDKRAALELLLLRALYQVGDKYPGDVVRCASLFDFERLYATPHPAAPGTPASSAAAGQ